MKSKSMKNKSLICSVCAVTVLLTATMPVGITTVYADTTEAVMYRMYNPNSGEHFYTANAGEKDNLKTAGWNYEGIGWVAPSESDTPVYRVYNPNSGDHHYTTSAGERDSLITVGWNDEGIGWYSDDALSVAVYREYNPNALTGSHNYTTNAAEDQALVAAGWNAEGIGWYAVPGSAETQALVAEENQIAEEEAAARKEAEELADYYSETNVYNRMIVMQDQYPQGMSWTNANYYKWNGGIYTGGYGCSGFAFAISDAAFGDLKARKHYDQSAIRVGDIVRVANNTHSVIVLAIDDTGITVAEGNYSSKVRWGRHINYSKMGFTYVMTRYPQ